MTDRDTAVDISINPPYFILVTWQPFSAQLDTGGRKELREGKRGVRVNGGGGMTCHRKGLLSYNALSKWISSFVYNSTA